ncbi:MAG: CsgG/HfaB family protein [Candidatus Omnitrophota bacterium]
MNKIIVSIFFFCGLVLLSSLAYADKMRIGFVEQIDSTVEVPEAIKQNLKEGIRQDLVNSGKFEVVDRNQQDTNRLLEEMKLSDQRLGRVDATDTKKAEFGKLAGMEYMVLVSINDFFSGEEPSKFQNTSPGKRPIIRLGVNLRLLQTSTGKIQLEKSVLAKRTSQKAIEGQPEALDMELVNKVIKTLSDKVLRQVMDEAYPVLIMDRNGNSAFVNRGQDSGIAVGDEMEVFAMQKATDEGTQEIVNLAHSVGKIKVVSVSDKTAQVEITEDFGISKGCVAKVKVADQVTTEDVAKSIEKKKNAEDW